MKLIAAGSFQEDGTWVTDNLNPNGLAPIGVERVQKIEAGLHHIHFSVDTQRTGTHKYKWYVQARQGETAAEVEWVKPKLAKIRWKNVFTGATQHPNAWSLLIFREIPVSDEESGGLVVVSGINPDGTLNSDPSPIGNYANRGVQSVEMTYGSDYGRYEFDLNTDISRAGCAWFTWYTPPPGGSPLYINVGFAGSRQRYAEFEFGMNDQGGGNPPVPDGPWSLVMYKFRDTPAQQS